MSWERILRWYREQVRRGLWWPRQWPRGIASMLG
jgi:hypothetical protein